MTLVQGFPPMEPVTSSLPEFVGGDIRNTLRFSLTSVSADIVENPCQEMIVPRYRKGPSTCFDNNATVRRHYVHHHIAVSTGLPSCE